MLVGSKLNNDFEGRALCRSNRGDFFISPRIPRLVFNDLFQVRLAKQLGSVFGVATRDFKKLLHLPEGRVSSLFF